MADCQDQPGLYVITGGKELPLCITHDRPFKSRKVAHGLPGECPAAGQPAKMFPFPGRPDAYLSSFGLEADKERA